MTTDEMTTTGADRGQVTGGAAAVYEEFFVPALFSQWTDRVLDAAAVDAGHRVVDVGCGTGVLAAAARERVGPGGAVTGFDPNDGMLAVARSTHIGIDWRQGTAEDLPFADRAYDRAVSQFALMFFTDPDRALAEIVRVTRPDGRIALAVWDGLAHNAGYARLADLLGRLFGNEAAEALGTPFRLGDRHTLAALVSGGVADPVVTAHRGEARFASLETWLHTEVRGWTLAETIDDEGFDRLLRAASSELGDLTGPAGVAFEVSALIVSGAPLAPA
jgi:SAM-dependent methyltransferase